MITADFIVENINFDATLQTWILCTDGWIHIFTINDPRVFPSNLIS